MVRMVRSELIVDVGVKVGAGSLDVCYVREQVYGKDSNTFVGIASAF